MFRREPKEAEAPAQNVESMSVLEALATASNDEAIGLLSRRERILKQITDATFRVRPGRGMYETAGASDSVNGGGGALKEAFNLGSAGVSVPDSQLMWYASQTFPGFQILGIIAQHWLVQKCISVPVEDAVRNGWTLRAGGDELSVEQQAYIEEMDDEFDVKRYAERHAIWTRTFGLRITLFIFDVPDPDKFYELPFNKDAVRPYSYRGMSQVDPYWCAPELSAQAAGDPSAQDFYVPTWWIINGKRVHRSHLCIGLGDEVSDVLKPSYLFSGLSVTQKIVNRVYGAERISDEAPGLAVAKRIRTLYTNIGKAIAKQDEMTRMLTLRAQTMSNFGTDVIDKESDLVQFDDVSLTDFPDLTMTQYQLVCAVAGVPSTKILGTSPKGFNATGEHEAKGYAETKQTIQERLCTPLLKAHYKRLMLSHIAPKFGDLKGRNIKPVWNPTDTPTSAEQAEINLQKAQTDQILVETGAVDGIDVNNRLVADPASGYGNLKPKNPGEELIGDLLRGNSENESTSAESVIDV